MYPKPVVTVLALGGTIAMAGDEGALRPAVDAGGLVGGVPGLDELAEVDAVTVASLPSASLTFAEVMTVCRQAESAVGNGSAGIVVTVGTDTLEEVAYLLDLWWSRSAPLVVTGAMRGATQAGADGPANLLAAVAVAADPAAAQYGCLVVMADSVHAARSVRKTDSRRPEAFTSALSGPIGTMLEGRPVFHAALRQPAPLPFPSADSGVRTPSVAIVESVLGDDGRMLRLVAESGYDAVVLAATGVGHVSAAVAEEVRRLGDALPIVFATRTGSGLTSRRTYQFPGSEMDLLALSAIPAGILDARKARVLLVALLLGGAAPDDIRRAFDERSVP